MRALRRFFLRLTRSATRRQDEARLREELEDHLALQTDDYTRTGLSEADARRRAALTFGGVEAMKEAWRDERRLAWVEHLLQDARIAVRRMKQAPGFTLAAVATLALGLGVGSAVVSLANGLFLKPLPVDDAARLVIVDQTIPDRPLTNGYGHSYPDYLYYREHARTVSGLAGHYSTSPMQVVTPDGAFNVSGSVASASYFSVLRLQPALGRFYSAAEDDVPGAHPVAVLSHDLWRSGFAQAPGAIGSSVRINGTTFTVVGVAPKGFRGTLGGVSPNDVWIPTAMFGVGYRYCNALARGCNMVNLIGRLADGASIADAQAEIGVLASQLAAAFPGTNRNRGALVRAARGIRIENQAREAPIVTLLGGGAALVLLVASANVAGLLLARGLRRRKEIAIRRALGASRGRVVRLLLVESIVLALAGGAAGFVVAIWTMDVLRGFFGVSYVGGALNVDFALDLRVVLLGAAVAALTGVITGVAPALQASRSDALPALKQETPGAGGHRSRLREGLIVLQVAVSVMLLAGSGLLVRSFLMVHRGPGFDPDAVVLLRLRPSLVGYTNERSWAFQHEVIRRLEALPGIVAASPAGSPPLPGWNRQADVGLPGTTGEAADTLTTGMVYVGPRYFRTLGCGVVQGREFDDRDSPDGAARVAIVNETLARRLWPDGRAVGNSILVSRARHEIVGVVRDLQYLNALEPPQPAVYLDFWQQNRADNWSSDAQLHVRISGPPATLLSTISQTIGAVDPDVPMSDTRTLGDRIDYQFSQVRLARGLLLGFGGLAFGLSTIGLYAALAFAVGQRRREMAIRLALGAARSHVGRLVFRHGFTIVGLGLAMGLAAAILGAGPLLASLLYGVSPRDPLALLAGPLVLGIVAAAAIWFPARRAMTLDAVDVLRSE